MTENMYAKGEIISHVNLYSKASWYGAFKELALTAILFFGSLATYNWFCSTYGWWGSTQWIIWRALILVRMFIISHDCMHNSFFPKTSWNINIGRIIGAYALTPFEKWRRGHLFHHNMSGNLAVVNIKSAIYSGDTIFITKQEWDNMTEIEKKKFVLLRHPLIFFTVVPALVFGVLYRFVSKKRRSGAMFVNVYRTLDILFWNYVLGNGFWYMECIAMWLGASLGFMLFHLQHGVNTGYRIDDSHHDKFEASLKGSTFLDIPFWLKWATANIQYHYIHHINPQVPCYKLEKCHMDAPKDMWKDVTKVNMKLAWKSLWNVMWDDESKLYVGFT